MDEDEFVAWKTCWHVNLYFHELIETAQKCIVCTNTLDNSNDTRRSVFWMKGTRCSAGHSQLLAGATLGSQNPFGVCAMCDQTYVFDVVKGRQKCKRDGCRRTLRVHEEAVRRGLRNDTALLTEFLALVKKFSVYECAVHFEEVPFEGSSFSAFAPPTSGCNHDRNVCDACLKDGFENAIRNGRLNDLVCPDPECKNVVPFDRLRAHVSADVFKTYNKLLALQTMSKAENFRWCTCGHGQIHSPGENNPEWTCLVCKKRHCYICRDDADASCEHLRRIDKAKKDDKARQRQAAVRLFAGMGQRSERRRHRLDDEASEQEKSRISKKCPKLNCGNKIQRDEGCGHFTCKRCQTQFCWDCKVIWAEGKPMHHTGCKLGTKTTISKWNLDKTGYAPDWDQDPGYDTALDSGLFLINSHK